ncbi:MAG: type II toxin-antitoxin system HicA family toxin [Deltaproteobacteria bacterium]|nr:type II toxin-antitoxin system HicA family toxin [Deltaproteobacteria bacterium]
MSRLPLVNGAAMCRLLEQVGFRRVRQRGSHVYMVHADGRATVVPVHGPEDLGRGLIRRILRDSALSVEEYLRLR